MKKGARERDECKVKNKGYTGFGANVDGEDHNLYQRLEVFRNPHLLDHRLDLLVLQDSLHFWILPRSLERSSLGHCGPCG